jgi:hypothetical protein
MNRLKTLVLPCLFFGLSQSHGNAMTLEYRETTEDVVEHYQTTIEKIDDRAMISFTTSDQHYTVQAKENLAAQQCEIHSLPGDSIVEIRREQDQLTIIQGNKSFTRQIDQSPWYATINSMADFIISPEEKNNILDGNRKF